MPMEHEIAALKAKLVSAEDRVKELEASKVRWDPTIWNNLMISSL